MATVALGAMLVLWFFVPPARGVAGSYAIFALKYLFGSVSVAVYFLLILSGIFIAGDFGVSQIWSKLTGASVIFVSLCALVDILYPSVLNPGGVVGDFLAAVLKILLGMPGSFIVIGVLFLAGTLIIFDVGLSAVFRILIYPFVGIYFLAKEAIRKFSGKRVRVSQFPSAQQERNPKPLKSRLEKKKRKEKKNAPATAEEVSSGPATSQQDSSYICPPADLLVRGPAPPKEDSNPGVLEDALLAFGVKAEVKNVTVGPGVVRYELSVGAGQKISSIQSLSSDIAMRLRAPSVRILAPIPGKAAVGIEVPRINRVQINLKDLIEDDAFRNFAGRIPVILGKNIIGTPIVADLATMPHLLIGGATGSGKSVCVHNIIAGFLYRFSPRQMRLLLIDPKMVELTVYNGIPHLLSKVSTDVGGAVASLKWVVFEMERRLKLFSQAGVRDISGFRHLGEDLPYIVVIIDELADLMAVAQKAMELAITRLSQMSRACGIHLILSTQRPSVNVITGVIKANLPARISLKVISKIDSRTILDSQGGEALLGRGDMLYLQPGSSSLMRIQAPFVSRKEIEKIVAFIKKQEIPAEYLDFEKEVKRKTFSRARISDELFWEAAEFVVSQGRASTSLLQRRFHIGYSRAASLIDSMCDMGVVGSDMGPTKGREILIDIDSLRQMKERQ
ncbi:MAG: DNA translocase FtsK 4TM domain-containing protein [Elusimicrobia bacterium]|nr:DNA translocase FtsK 4TM domain-containing protein [Elusimicrobiota bacterium]